MRRRSTPRPPCGTDSGYHAHRWRGEVTCEACCAAHAEAERERKPRPDLAKDDCGTCGRPLSGDNLYCYRGRRLCRYCRRHANRVWRVRHGAVSRVLQVAS